MWDWFALNNIPNRGQPLKIISGAAGALDRGRISSAYCKRLLGFVARIKWQSEVVRESIHCETLAYGDVHCAPAIE